MHFALHIPERTAALSSQVFGRHSQATGATRMAKAIRGYGHLAANLNPLNSPTAEARELLPEHYGLTEADLAQLPASIVWGPVADGAAGVRVDGHRAGGVEAFHQPPLIGDDELAVEAA